MLSCRYRAAPKVLSKKRIVSLKPTIRPLTLKRQPICATSATSAPSSAITIEPKALEHLKQLRASKNDPDLVLRVGVRQGGCSGRSYHMDFEAASNVQPDDYVEETEAGFKLVCDSKSLLFLFGMRLGYSDALIGGGFEFQNPNATESCGCGKSFNV